ncbi:MAG: ATP-binding cassette domain-containing protein [Gammaproteobacteria bacterium]|jgi:ABC-2 type transport system ATP-binding protein
MTDSLLIEALGLSHHYGQLAAVREVNLTLRRGEVLGLLGPNGAGKSTTMNMLCGVLAPTAGMIRINGIDLLDEPRRAKQHIGYLPERPPVYRDMTVDEYLAYTARLHGLKRAGVSRALHNAKQRCGLEQAGRRLIGNLSKGYQQRVGIAQAILHEPAVVILDEPTVGLDPIQIHEIRDLIRDLGSKHSVLLSTHILPEVQAVCDRVQIIHQGQTVFDESLDTLARRESDRLLVGFAHPPAMEALKGVAGVSDVEALSEGRFRIRHAAATDTAAELARRSAEHDWGLRELTPERAGLEQIFMDLVYREAEAA